MKGKIYLIDLWATWCGPCVGEMEILHEVYQKYKDNGFEILSISFDVSPKEVKAFRKKDWKMPWLHAFSEGQFASKAAKIFEVSLKRLQEPFSKNSSKRVIHAILIFSVIGGFCVRTPLVIQLVPASAQT